MAAISLVIMAIVTGRRWCVGVGEVQKRALEKKIFLRTKSLSADFPLNLIG
jgi:hypothetical protein